MIDKTEIERYGDYRRILIRRPGFIYLAPHPGLRSWISNYTVTFPAETEISAAYTIIPHGSATLVVSCQNGLVSAEVFGPATRPCPVGMQANRAECLLIIEFQPAGLFTLTGIHQKELTDQVLPLELISTGLSRELGILMEMAGTLGGLVAALDRLLLSGRLRAGSGPFGPVLHEILLARGNVSVRRLSERSFYSERQLNRIFDEQAGMSIKSFSRLVRINHAIRLLKDQRSSITYAADAAGFYDLPHFARDFKSVCGVTPMEYRRKMSDFYSEVAKFQDILSEKTGVKR